MTKPSRQLRWYRANRERAMETMRLRRLAGKNRMSGRSTPGGDGVECLVCGANLWGKLHGHLRIHGLTLAEYRTRFPGARTASEHERAVGRDIWVDSHGALKWSAGRVLAAIRKKYRVSSRVPSGRDDPSLEHAALRFFGSWNEAVERAGFNPRRLGQTKRNPMKR